jgi:CubicO group peptidase (beta-lactamase class C family)
MKFVSQIVIAAILVIGFVAPLKAERWPLPIEMQERIDEVFAFVKRDAPGCALGVIQNGKVTYGRGYGVANMDWGIPISTSTVFDIGSVSKQFTASAIVLLHVEGILSLDDEIHKWIPELPEYQQPITIRHLLNHTSGIRDYLTLMTLQGYEFANVFNEFDGIELIARQQALNFDVGSEFLYSNSGYLLLANIVRRATNDSIRVFLENRFFEPLGMARSSIWDNNTEIVAERATGYGKEPDGWIIDHAWNFQMGGDGQVITSIDDLAKWDRLFYHPIVGDQALLDHLHTQGVLNNDETISYAMGLSIDDYRGLDRVQHGGAWAGFRAYLARFPSEQMSVALLCNRSDVNPTNLTNEVVDVVLSDLLNPEDVSDSAQPPFPDEPIMVPGNQLAHWQGVYLDDDLATFAVELVGEKLVGRAQGQEFPLIPHSQTDFLIAGVGIKIRFSGKSNERRATILSSGNSYHMIELYDASPQELKAIVGDYRSQELDVTWQFLVEENKLMLKRNGFPDATTVFTSKDGISIGGVGLVLERQVKAISGFRVSAGRVKNIQFTRM